jgi:xanthine dehydrogenase large subunit
MKSNATTNHNIHESAILHVTGKAVYVDDILVHEQELLVGRVVYSPHAHARILSFDLSEARQVPGVFAVLSHHDIPGENQMGPVFKDEPCLAVDKVECVGQALFIIAGKTEEACRMAEKKIKVEYEVLPPLLELKEVISKGVYFDKERRIERGQVDTALAQAPHRLKGELTTGAQEHWYLETQVCLCIPGEGKELFVYSSTQHPSETQHLISELLHLPSHEVQVQVKRMGGAFGGKETQANHTACWTALLCFATRKPVKIRLFREDDQKITGKRHPFLSYYHVGFDENGKLLAADFELHSDAGCATDLSLSILERAMLHVDNSYYIPHIRILGKAWKTNHPSNTAFRGFGGPQGMAIIENLIDRIARFLQKDPLDVRVLNFYGTDSCHTTPYGEVVENNRLPLLYEQLVQSSEYRKRRQDIQTFNATHEFTKRGIAFTPVKFGISFTAAFLNQAGALVNLYKDGSVLVNHGGTEMGQGLHTKIRSIAAKEWGIPLERVKVNATDTSKVPNTSATAASAGTDLNGMAVKNAIDILKERLLPVILSVLNTPSSHPPTQAEDIVYENDLVFDQKHPERSIPFPKLMPIAHFQQVSLSTTGFYRTPHVHFDKDKGQGRPFHYFAFGMAVSEIELDLLTGYHQALRTDILHDVGDSLNPEIDKGQVEGAYIQGVGWCTTEEIKWNEKGELLSYSPDTYKIPSVRDIPKDFRTALLQNAPNPHTIRKSKAVAEPPFMLALAHWLALKDAISSIAPQEEPPFSLPATHEVILHSLVELKKRLKR